jgi:hypothetical protein
MVDMRVFEKGEPWGLRGSIGDRMVRGLRMNHGSQWTSTYRIIRVAMLLLPLVLAAPSRAYGYTDPGTGAFIYQAAYAAFLGGSFYLRKFLDRFFGKKKR